MTLQELSNEDRLRLMRFVCSFAWADLHVHEKEKTFLRGRPIDGRVLLQVGYHCQRGEIRVDGRRIISPPACASQPLEKCEQSIAGFETSRGHARSFDRGQRSLLHREVRGEILVSGRGGSRARATTRSRKDRRQPAADASPSCDGTCAERPVWLSATRT